jgi:hypothetical protein
MPLLLLFIPVFGVLAFIFGRNAHRGIRTGAVYLESARYVRTDQPFLFWFALVLSTVISGACVFGIAFIIWGLVTLT